MINFGKSGGSGSSGSASDGGGSGSGWKIGASTSLDSTKQSLSTRKYAGSFNSVLLSTKTRQWLLLRYVTLHS